VSTTGHFITLLAAVLGGVAIISAGIWRVAAAIFKLANTVALLAYRVEQVEKRQLGLPAVPLDPHRRRRG
jgi:hypothetical protein